MSKTVTHRDTAYDAETAAAISTRRAERWGLFLTIEQLQEIDTEQARRKLDTHWRRVRRLDSELYQLTQNPIYDVTKK